MKENMLRSPITLLALAASLLSAQVRRVDPPPDPAGRLPGKIILAVEVTDAVGNPIASLQQADFTVLDNGTLIPIRSFRLTDLGAPRGETPRFLYEVIIDRAPNTPQRVYHRLDVRVDRRNLKVDAMRGYFTGPPLKAGDPVTKDIPQAE